MGPGDTYDALQPEILEPVAQARTRTLGGEDPTLERAVQETSLFNVVLAGAPVVVARQTNPAGEFAPNFVFHRPHPKALLSPMPDKSLDPLPGLLASEGSRHVAHDLRVGAQAGVGFEVFVSLRTQQEAGGLKFDHPEA
jgi:hypothetical protein